LDIIPTRITEARHLHRCNGVIFIFRIFPTSKKGGGPLWISPPPANPPETCPDSQSFKTISLISDSTEKYDTVAKQACLGKPVHQLGQQIFDSVCSVLLFIEKIN